MEKIEYEDKEIIIYKLMDPEDRYYIDHKNNRKENYYTNMSYIESNIYNKKIRYKQINMFELIEKEEEEEENE